MAERDAFEVRFGPRSRATPGASRPISTRSSVSDRGPARYDGTGWTFPYEGAGLPSMQLAAVAPDGTVFGSIGSVLRLPDLAPPP